MKIFNKVSIAVLVIAFTLVLTGPAVTFAATTPSLGTATTFGILSNLFQGNASTTITGVVGNDLLGALGYSSTAGLGIIKVVNGTTENTTDAWTAAGLAQGVALANLNSQYLNSCINIGETGGLNAIVINGGTAGHFPPGCYYREGAMNIVEGTTVNLDGAGTYIFKSTGGAITTGANSHVALNNSASACDVFWTPVGATTLGANSTFKGTVLDAAGINIGNTVAWEGRALAFGGSVYSDADITAVNTIDVPTCTNPASLTVTKTVVNTGGGSKVVADFPLLVGATSVTSGVLNNFTAGAYVITETINSNYTQTFSSSCPGGNITLASGQDYICTITNTYVPPSSSGSGGSSTHYGCKDPNASNYEYFASSDPALCVYTATSTMVVHQLVTTIATTTLPLPTTATTTTVIIPKLPNTGLPPEGGSIPWNIVMLVGVLVLVSTSLGVVLRKSTI